MRTIDRDLEDGSIVELGQIRGYDVTDRGSGIHLLALHEGETSEYVVLSKRFSDGESIDLPQGSTVIDIRDGEGVANPICWYLTPKQRWSE